MLGAMRAWAAWVRYPCARLERLLMPRSGVLVEREEQKAVIRIKEVNGL